MCSKDKRLKDLAGLASLGQLGYRHWECYGWRKGHVGVEEAAQQEFGRLKNQEGSELSGLHGLLVQCQLEKKQKTLLVLYDTVKVNLNSFGWFSAEIKGYLSNGFTKCYE